MRGVGLELSTPKYWDATSVDDIREVIDDISIKFIYKLDILKLKYMDSDSLWVLIF